MTQPYLIISMGVSGSGKSTVAQMLAQQFDLTFLEADDFHSPTNKAHMAAGKALTDAMREPWIASICDKIKSDGNNCILAYSGLRRAHRQKFRELGFKTLFLYLNGSKELIAQRMSERAGHFMPVSLLDSQFASMDAPQNEPDMVLVSIDDPIPQIVANTTHIVESFITANK
ncbi:gluconokinase [Marinagarivorans algicola]|uniref:gluconokinase n=1 Tax=Marinagarivorans algicola TaxID=1513270 RepID=UPI0006B5832D|nr:gluconokinase [Marinagarivorans algicola]